VGLADLAGDPHRHHLRRRHLCLATHPVTSRSRSTRRGFTNQQARTLTYVILDLVAGTPPAHRPRSSTRRHDRS
jgi:hypothetical protein